MLISCTYKMHKYDGKMFLFIFLYKRERLRGKMLDFIFLYKMKKYEEKDAYFDIPM